MLSRMNIVVPILLCGIIGAIHAEGINHCTCDSLNCAVCTLGIESSVCCSTCCARKDPTSTACQKIPYYPYFVCPGITKDCGDEPCNVRTFSTTNQAETLSGCASSDCKDLESTTEASKGCKESSSFNTVKTGCEGSNCKTRCSSENRFMDRNYGDSTALFNYNGFATPPASFQFGSGYAFQPLWPQRQWTYPQPCLTWNCRVGATCVGQPCGLPTYCPGCYMPNICASGNCVWKTICLQEVCAIRLCSRVWHWPFINCF